MEDVVGKKQSRTFGPASLALNWLIKASRKFLVFCPVSLVNSPRDRADLIQSGPP